MPPRPKKPPPQVVRRTPGEPKRGLPPDFEALARGERPARKPMAPRLDDPRDDFLVRGVANRDARAVFDRRLGELKAAKGDELADALCDAVLLGLWRARRLTSLDVLVSEMLELDPARAHELAGQAATRRGLACETQREELVAVWMRFEAAQIEAELTGRATLRATPTGPVLSLELPPAEVAQGIVVAGRKIAPLATAAGPRRGPPRDRRPDQRDDRGERGDRGPGSQRFRRRP